MNDAINSYAMKWGGSSVDSSSSTTSKPPTSGGFEAARYKRNLSFRGTCDLAILGAVAAVCAYGFYCVAKGNLE
jgi:hypothetical protein